ASTSLVRLLSAMTEGSFRTMPSLLAYTSVFAVPRSIARSRASSGSPSVPCRRPFPVRVRREGPHLLVELLDRGSRGGRRRPGADPQHQEADAAEAQGDEQVDEVVHGAALEAAAAQGSSTGHIVEDDRPPSVAAPRPTGAIARVAPHDGRVRDEPRGRPHATAGTARPTVDPPERDRP